jgi:hypothetical protein
VDPRQFDELVKRLSRSISRRKVLGGSIGTSLGAVTAAAAAAAAAVEDVFAKGDGKKKQHAAGKGKGGKKNRGQAAGQGKKKKKKSPGQTGSQGGPQSENCVATGQRCGPPDCIPRRGGKKKGKGKGKGKNRCLPCSRCCSRHSVPAERGGKRCACRPNGFSCNPANPAQCCSAVCDPARGVCTDRFVS